MASSCVYVRRPTIVILHCAIVALLSGCISVTTKTALYDREKDRVFDDKLLGTWVGPKDKPLMVTLKRSERASYAVVIEDNAEAEFEGEFEARAKAEDGGEREPETGLVDLVEIGSRRYLFAVDHEAERETRRQSLPWVKIKRHGDQLDAWFLDTQRLGQMLHDDPSLLPHEWAEPYREPAQYRREDYSRGKVAIMPTREQMRRFLREHDSELYSTSVQLKRPGKN